jgi:Na+/glutamate symporter
VIVCDLSGTGEPMHGVEQLPALFGGQISVAGGQGASDAVVDVRVEDLNATASSAVVTAEIWVMIPMQ